MKTDKELTIEFLQEEAPKLYEELQASGELDTLSRRELVNRYASLANEPMTDISDDDIPPVNMDMIVNVIKTSKARNKQAICKKAVFTFSISKLAIAVSAIVVLGIGISMMISSNTTTFQFTDLTSQETTDYDIRVHNNETSNLIFHDDFVKLLNSILEQRLKLLEDGNSYFCVLSPVEDCGDKVQLTIHNQNNGQTATKELLLKSNKQLNNFLHGAVSEFIQKAK